MNTEVKDIGQILADSWANFLESLPSIILAILIGIVGAIIIRFISKNAYRIIDTKSKDPLVSSFLVNMLSIILSIFLIVLCLSIIGWGSLTNKILAGAGLGTFVIGFALKDIGENFLAGILMAFSRPFRTGDLIEIEGLRGRVIQMSLRETTIKSLDGRDIYIPNGLILKNPLQNYTIDNYIRQEFMIGLDYNDDVDNIILLIEETINQFEQVEKHPEPLVFIDELATSTVNVKAQYWIMTTDVRAPGYKLRSNIMFKVYKSILDKGYRLPSDIVEVAMLNGNTIPEN